jgi:hypothetical protein
MDLQRKEECQRRGREIQGKVSDKGYSQKHEINYDEVFAPI